MESHDDAHIAATAANNARMPSSDHAPPPPSRLQPTSASAEVADVAAATSLRKRRAGSGRTADARLDDRQRSANDGVGMEGRRGRGEKEWCNKSFSASNSKMTKVRSNEYENDDSRMNGATILLPFNKGVKCVQVRA